MKKITTICLAILFCLGLINVTHAGNIKIPLKGDIVVAGTGDSQKLLKAVAKRFEEVYPGTTVKVPNSIGSTGGIKAAAKGESDIGRVARTIREKEKKYGLTYKIFAKSPVVFVANNSFRNVKSITAKQIVDVYSGVIVNWKELGGNDSKIYPIDRETDDSSRNILEKEIQGFKGIKNRKSKTVYSTPETLDILKAHKNTIGYMPLSEAKAENLRVLKIDGFFPSAENIIKGKYQMQNTLGIVYKGELKPLAKAFVDFLFSSEGEKIITAFGSVPVK